ncbi:hypothetical protein CMUS01_07102 [Colletotrichum musicola]|uniref:Uncharacterized protein n=1 Tax=Colletotrichum musicola TaxID=2175873 RepID=A0A8H6KIJ4_9PEZI|nr:hypothetical protein CMUS01_07102 [Colletotrichum musicola]
MRPIWRPVIRTQPAPVNPELGTPSHTGTQSRTASRVRSSTTVRSGAGSSREPRAANRSEVAPSAGQQSPRLSTAGLESIPTHETGYPTSRIQIAPSESTAWQPPRQAEYGKDFEGSEVDDWSTSPLSIVSSGYVGPPGRTSVKSHDRSTLSMAVYLSDGGKMTHPRGGGEVLRGR